MSAHVLLNLLNKYMKKDKMPFCIKFNKFSNTGAHTVKPVLSDHSKIDTTEILMTVGSLMKIKSIAECSPWGILQYF